MIGPTDVISVIGRRGYGKTTVSKGIQDAFPRVVVVDLLREYSARISSDFVVTSFKGLCEKALELEHKPKFKLIYQPEISDDDETAFNEAMGVIYALGNVLLVVEEIHNFASSNAMPTNLRKIIFLGRHQGIAVLVTTQRPARLHKDILSQSDHVFAGAIHESNDIRYLSEVMGDDAEKLKNLVKSDSYREFLYYRPGEDSKIVKVYPKKN